MVFPQTPLPLKVELMVGSTWTDVTSDVRGEQQIRINRGRSDEGSSVEPTRCTFTLDNNSGNYSPKNPNGAYYGQIGRNTPCRVSVHTGSIYLDLPGSTTAYAETADTAVLDITGDLDVRVDASLINWLPPDGAPTTESIEIIGKMQSTSQQSWLLAMQGGHIMLAWSNNGTAFLTAKSTESPVIPGAGGRLAIRATLDVDNGAGGRTIRFYTSDTLDGVWTQLGDPVVQSGTTSIFSSTSSVRIGKASVYGYSQPIGRFHAAEIRNGIWGTVVANPYFSNQAVGTTSFADSAGRTWTVNGAAAITNRKTRFTGEISAWPVRWETKHDVVVQVEASGVMRRLSQGASPVRSALYREYTSPTRSGIVAYWPMEDGSTATSFASALDGEQGMTVTSFGVERASYSNYVASDALPAFTTGRARGRVPSYTATPYIFMRFFIAVPSSGVPTTQRLLSFSQSGTARTWRLYINSAGNLDLRAYNEDGTQVLATGFSSWSVNGVERIIVVELSQDGADIDYLFAPFLLEDMAIDRALLLPTSGTLAGYTVGAATEVRVGEDGDMNGTAIGHIVFSNSNTTFVNSTGSMIGWDGETADARIYRLGDEDQIPAFPTGATEQDLGPQRLSALLDLMREAEAADGGILYELRDAVGLAYRTRVSLYNQPAAMVLDYEGDDGLVTPLDPVDDDQRVRNDVTVARSGGSSARVTLDEGTLSTQAPPDGVGRYDESLTLNLHDDEQVANHAGWRLHLGTWDATRYPVVKLLLQNATHMIEDAAALDIGDRFHITNPPSWLPPDTIDLRVEGYTETLDQFTWTLEYNCSPAGAWDVGWVGSATTASYAREFASLDTAGSQLAEALTSTETDVDILTTSGPRWTDEVKDTPFDLRTGGEVMTVTAPSSLLNTNPFFDTTVTGWTAQSSSISWSQSYVCPHPRALGSLRIVPDGVSAIGGALGDATAIGSITPGVVYTLSCWVFSVNGWSDLQPCVNWYDSGGSLVSSATGTSMTVASSVWTYLEQDFTAPASSSQAKVRLRHGGTPAASDIWYVWAARITRSKSSWLHDTFPRTVASGWGSADTGQAWSTSGGTAADYAVTGGYGSHTVATAGVSRRSFTGFTYADFDVYVSLTTSATATGGSLFAGPTGRYTDSDNLYKARVEFSTSNTLTLTIRKRLASVESQLGAYTLMGAYTPGTYVRVRFQAEGSTLRAKAWLASGVEPDPWQIEVTDTSLTTSLFIGVRSISSSANTNVNPQVRYDDLEVVNPQTFTVTRSQNGVVKTHSAGADVALANPLIIAL